jgi:regulator of protease activity HflC (stomatin/prohibitin superfamily)
VQEKAVPPGDYYINPYVESIVPVDTRSHPVEFDDIKFPSRDGFEIKPHVLVAYKVMPEKAPELFVMLCDNGQLPQEHGTAELQKKNPILQKVVLPLIRGYVRIEGSKYDARDYVSQQRDDKAENAVNPREKLQEELMKKVAPRCQEAGILIETITVAQPEMNKDLVALADQIAERERTRVTREKNKQLVEQHKQEQEQQSKEALAAQRKTVVEAKTKLEVEKTLAKQLKEVAEAKLENELKAAQARLDGARETAKLTVIKGTGEAAVINADNEAEVAGLKTAIGGFPSPDHFAQYHVLHKLSPALTEIFASDSSDFAKMFSSYLTSKKIGVVTLPAPRGEATADAKKPGK